MAAAMVVEVAAAMVVEVEAMAEAAIMVEVVEETMEGVMAAMVAVEVAAMVVEAVAFQGEAMVKSRMTHMSATRNLKKHVEGMTIETGMSETDMIGTMMTEIVVVATMIMTIVAAEMTEIEMIGMIVGEMIGTERAETIETTEMTGTGVGTGDVTKMISMIAGPEETEMNAKARSQLHRRPICWTWAIHHQLQLLLHQLRVGVLLRVALTLQISHQLLQLHLRQLMALATL